VDGTKIRAQGRRYSSRASQRALRMRRSMLATLRW
jgi:hypothetical protein